jgi:hypothetical protein
MVAMLVEALVLLFSFVCADLSVFSALLRVGELFLELRGGRVRSGVGGGGVCVIDGAGGVNDIMLHAEFSELADALAHVLVLAKLLLCIHELLRELLASVVAELCERSIELFVSHLWGLVLELLLLLLELHPQIAVRRLEVVVPRLQV